MRTRTLVIAATAGSCAALAGGSAPATPLVVANQPGVVRQTERAAKWAAWTRCVAPEGPSEVWARRSGQHKLTRILRTARPCDAHDLVGIFNNGLFLLAQRGNDLRRLLAVDLRDRSRSVVDQETPGAGGRELLAADVNGPSLAWIRVVGPADARMAEVVVRNLATGVDRIAHRRELASGAVRLVGVWVNARGDVAIHEVLRGEVFLYGNGQERIRLLRARDGGFRTLASVRGLVHVAAADLGGTRFSYSLVRENDLRVWVYGWDLTQNRRRLLRVARAAPPTGAITPPAVAEPRLYADAVVWRERTRRGRRAFNDGVRRAGLIQGPRQRIFPEQDVRGQRIFVGPPALYKRIVMWPVTTFTGNARWRGGYEGLSTRRARTKVMMAPLPRS